MIYKIIPFLLIGLFAFTTNLSSNPTPKTSRVVETTVVEGVESSYKSLKTNNFELPQLESFSNALEGFYKLKEKGLIQKDLLTLVDFSLSSAVKRLWVIDVKNNIILFQSLVAHGKNSGNEFANQFSNKSESHKSSLGFYTTGETYFGKHGFSLRLDGLETGINNNARNRAIVIHGADYVSESFIQQNGRLGRSFGCPSVPIENTQQIINIIKDKSCFFVYYPSKKN
ncbi:MAG: murein L,D-transpeptidase catalytic domain family protein [Flavobacteriaceae bacterium]|nr:murein L,D-transpeptidase catalytic domain family protein [Flavobacteriaceae bacterium]